MKVTAKETITTYVVELTEVEAKGILRVAHDLAGRHNMLGGYPTVIDLGQQLHDLGVRP